VIVEVHPDPDQALSDGAQSLTFSMFSDLMKDLAVISTLTPGKVS
jgi:3-deoxy-7-phosphoheptulonate synthase